MYGGRGWNSLCSCQSEIFFFTIQNQPSTWLTTGHGVNEEQLKKAKAIEAKRCVFYRLVEFILIFCSGGGGGLTRISGSPSHRATN